MFVAVCGDLALRLYTKEETLARIEQKFNEPKYNIQVSYATLPQLLGEEEAKKKANPPSPRSKSIGLFRRRPIQPI